MRTVYKYRLELGETVIPLPVDSKVLHVDSQKGHLTVWIEVNKETARHRNFGFQVIGTGHDVPKYDYRYVGTVLSHDDFVWHVYVN